ncbi:MAG: DUF4238 domain-containing protein, partial [Candidatus Acidiferrum sp.]
MTQYATAEGPRQSVTHDCHVLPICYQHSFTNDKDELFVRFFASGKPPLPLHPVKVGVMKDFYIRRRNGIKNDGIERLFGDYVEGEYAPVAKRLKEQKNNFTLKVNDAPGLLKFAASQLVRTEAHFRCVSEQAGTT